MAFITNYSEDHGLALPGRILGCRKDAAKLLTTSETKVKVHNAYKSACKQGGKSLTNKEINASLAIYRLKYNYFHFEALHLVEH